MERPLYLDYNATTPVDVRVLDAMIPYFSESPGNPSSAHVFGYEGHDAVLRARLQVARLIGASPDDVVFTASGSESDNLAIKGVVLRRLNDQPHIVATAIEHPAVLNTLEYLERRFDVRYTLVPVDGSGIVSPAAVEAAMRPTTVLVSVMHANNETGAIQPIEAIGAITRRAGVLFHVDAAQSTGKIPVNADTLGADLLTIAGHKLYAPKGIGALYIRPGTLLDPLVHGSSQEGGIRAGTESVTNIVGFGEACELAQEELGCEGGRLLGLRDELQQQILKAIPDAIVNGDLHRRLPNTLNISFPGLSGGALLAAAPNIAASTGAACHSGDSAPSSVLLAMGLSRDRAAGAIRVSVGRFTRAHHIPEAADSVVRAFTQLTESAPLA